VLQSSRSFYGLQNWGPGDTWDFCKRAAKFAPLEPALRQFALEFQSSATLGAVMPYLLTVPERLGASEPPAVDAKYPLLVYLHSAGGTDICKGDVRSRQLQFVTQEAPHCVLYDRGQTGLVDEFIGLALCCPANLNSLNCFQGYSKCLRKWKVYWFKACDGQAYSNWDFSKMLRLPEVEVLVTELLLRVCSELPVDPARISFVGFSGGGYAVLRLGEVLPALPAAIVPFAGYYPCNTEQDHDPQACAERIKGAHVWPLHCQRDKVCKTDSPHVAKIYHWLKEILGVEVEWVSESVSKGSSSNYHSASQQIFKEPNAFFLKLLRSSRREMRDAASYLAKRLAELRAQPTASALIAAGGLQGQLGGCFSGPH